MTVAQFADTAVQGLAVFTAEQIADFGVEHRVQPPTRLITENNLFKGARLLNPQQTRQALMLRPDDVMLVITSAGCNVLDYAIDGPARIHAVDANPRQTALLELKLAGIRHLGFDDFFGFLCDTASISSMLVGIFSRMRRLTSRSIRSRVSACFSRAW